jgi:CheY-like chemotaxis protein
MPVLNGIEATLKIRELGGLAAHLPIIAVTTYANHENHEAYVLAGMNDLVGKPYDTKHLIHIVEFWLAKNLCET